MIIIIIIMIIIMFMRQKFAKIWKSWLKLVWILRPPVTKDMKVLTAVVMKSSVFRHITVCNPLKVDRRFGGTCRLQLFMVEEKAKKKPAWIRQQAKLGRFYTSKMEAIYSSEMSVEFEVTTWRYNPKYITLHSSPVHKLIMLHINSNTSYMWTSRLHCTNTPPMT
jgi:hypothetical protein